MPVLGLQFHFWQFSPSLQWIYIDYIQMHWCCRLLTSDIYQSWLQSHVLVFNLLSAWGTIQNIKRLKTNFKGGHFWPLMHIVLSQWKLKISHELRLMRKFSLMTFGVRIIQFYCNIIFYYKETSIKIWNSASLDLYWFYLHGQKQS